MDKPKCWVKIKLKDVQLNVKVGLKFEITFLTQHLGLSKFDRNLGSNNPALFRVLISFPLLLWVGSLMVNDIEIW